MNRSCLAHLPPMPGSGPSGPVSWRPRLIASTSDQISAIRPQAMRKMLIPVQVALRPEGGRSPSWPLWVPVAVLHQELVELVAQVGEGAEEVGHHRGHPGHVHGVGVAARGMVDGLGGEEPLQGVGIAPVDHARRTPRRIFSLHSGVKSSIHFPMTLAFTRPMAPETPYLMAAVLSGRRRPRQRPGAKDWLKIAHRLAAGLPPRAAALPEGADETLVAASPGTRGVPDHGRGLAGRCSPASPEAHRKRLVLLARQALERVLICDDAPVAVFVLEEEAHDRDPAVTLAEGVLKAKARTLRPPAEQPPKPRIGRYRWDPLRSMMHRGTARLRHDIQAEDAIRHAALAATA